MKMHPYFLVSLCAYLLLVAGLLLRKKRQTHAFLMTLGIAIDLGMVLFLELHKGAVQEVLKGGLKPWLLYHVLVSSVAVVLYIPVLILGIRRLKKIGDASNRWWHIRLGTSAFSFRTAGLIFLFLHLYS